jgi:hypothetical protein
MSILSGIKIDLPVTYHKHIILSNVKNDTGTCPFLPAGAARMSIPNADSLHIGQKSCSLK